MRWVSSRKRFLLPVKPLARLFRRLFLEKLQAARAKGEFSLDNDLAKPGVFEAFLAGCRAKEWFVYSKPPFGGPEKTLDYLARYTHRTAIANTRLLKLEDGRVSFRYKDYAHGGAIKVMELEAVEFLRRFFTHVLPKGFVRVRHFGLFANRFRKESLARCRDLLGTQEPEQLSDLAALAWPDRMLLLTGHDPILCPVCKKGRLLLVEAAGIPRATRDPPAVETPSHVRSISP